MVAVSSTHLTAAPLIVPVEDVTDSAGELRWASVDSPLRVSPCTRRCERKRWGMFQPTGARPLDRGTEPRAEDTAEAGLITRFSRRRCLGARWPDGARSATRGRSPSSGDSSSRMLSQWRCCQRNRRVCVCGGRRLRIAPLPDLPAPNVSALFLPALSERRPAGRTARDADRPAACLPPARALGPHFLRVLLRSLCRL